MADRALNNYLADRVVSNRIPARPMPTVATRMRFIPQTFEERKAAGYRSPYPVASVVEIGKEEAQFILERHNQKNRAINPRQLQNIRHSIDKWGWIFDGSSFAFYTCGNLHDSQHRLTEALRLPDGETMTVVMAWGVEPDAGQCCAKSKARSCKEEIERHDKSITNDEAAVVGDIAKRRKNEWALDSCYDYWRQWKTAARRGIALAEDLDSLELFSSQRKALRSFAALASHFDLEDEAICLFGLIRDHVTGDGSTLLASSFVATWENLAIHATQETRLTLLFDLLCHALTQVRKSERGDLEMRFGLGNGNPMRTKLTGVG